MPLVWTSEIYVEKEDKTVRILPRDIMERKEINKIAQSSKKEEWERFSFQLENDETKTIKTPYPARIGGGVLTVVSLPQGMYYALVMRDEKAPSYKLSYDIFAGIPDTTNLEKTMYEFGNQRLVMPQTYRLIYEQNELGFIVRYKDSYKDSIAFYIPVLRNVSEEVKRHLVSSALSGYLLLSREIKIPKIIIEESGEIGSFSESYKIHEYDIEGKNVISELGGATITVEKESGSVEVIWPIKITPTIEGEIRPIDAQFDRVKPFGYEFIFYDMEAIGNFDNHGGTLIINDVNLLNRNIVLLSTTNPNSSYGTIVYKGGRTIYRGKLNEWIEVSGLRDAIRRGETTGLTPKVKHLYKLGEKDVGITFSDRELKLDSFRELGRMLYEIKNI